MDEKQKETRRRELFFGLLYAGFMAGALWGVKVGLGDAKTILRESLDAGVPVSDDALQDKAFVLRELADVAAKFWCEEFLSERGL